MLPQAFSETHIDLRNGLRAAALAARSVVADLLLRLPTGDQIEG